MKKVTMYEIRAYTGNSYSKPLSAKLRNKKGASKLVKRLKKSGIQAFSVPLKISR